MMPPAVPGSLEEISQTLGEVQRQLEALTLAFRTCIEELQAVRSGYDDLSDHCSLLAELLWSERGRSVELERQVEWFRELAGTRAERMRRDTPTEGLPVDPPDDGLPDSPE